MAEVRGNCQDKFVRDHVCGVDIGVETLCAALNMWKNVFTVNSCSGFHPTCLDATPNHSGSRLHKASLIMYVSDDVAALASQDSIYCKQQGQS
jgi:hypothetical protein